VASGKLCWGGPTFTSLTLPHVPMALAASRTLRISGLADGWEYRVGSTLIYLLPDLRSFIQLCVLLRKRQGLLSLWLRRLRWLYACSAFLYSIVYTFQLKPLFSIMSSSPSTMHDCLLFTVFPTCPINLYCVWWWGGLFFGWRFHVCCGWVPWLGDQWAVCSLVGTLAIFHYFQPFLWGSGVICQCVSFSHGTWGCVPAWWKTGCPCEWLWVLLSPVQDRLVIALATPLSVAATQLEVGLIAIVGRFHNWLSRLNCGNRLAPVVATQLQLRLWVDQVALAFLTPAPLPSQPTTRMPELLLTDRF